MSPEVATAIIAVISQLMQLMGTSEATARVIDTIINLLEKLIPLLVEIAPVVYASVKNIIIELKGDPATIQSQWDALDTLDAQLDAANAAAIAAVDPDAGSGVVS